jgi:hypothetical protein
MKPEENIFYPLKANPTTLLIDPIPQLPRTLKCHHPPRIQHHILATRWIPAPPLTLFLNAKFPKTADQDVLSRREFGFDQFEEDFNQLD